MGMLLLGVLAPSVGSAQGLVEEVNNAFVETAETARIREAQRQRAGMSALEAIDDTQALTRVSEGAPPATDGTHPAIAMLRGALWYWLDTDERALLAAVDTSRTTMGDPAVVQRFLVDRALRRFAPMALAACRRRAEAVALRGVAPVSDDRAMDSVARMAVVARIVRRRQSVEVATVEQFAQRQLRLGASMPQGLTGENDRDFAADRAVIAVAEAARLRDPAEIARVIAETSIAYGGRAERRVVVDEAVHLLEEATAIARGNPIVERPMPHLPVSIDPDADMLPNGALAAVRPRHARPRRGSVPANVQRTGPSARCFDDFRCLQNER